MQAAPLGSSPLSRWRHRQWVIHLPRWDFANFKRLLALAQQKRLLLSEGDGTDGWQESAEDASGLWSHRVASALLWPTATACSNCELDLVRLEQGGNSGLGRRHLQKNEGEEKEAGQELFLSCNTADCCYPVKAWTETAWFSSQHAVFV